MRALIQRVSRAQVDVDGVSVGAIGPGLLILLGVKQGDTGADVEALARKVAGLRIFEDEQGRMNRSVDEIGGGVLVVSQFTLYADTRKGRRPSFVDAAEPGIARSLYEQFVSVLRAAGLPVETGRFQAHMEVSLVNDGPVTILLESADGKML